MSDRATVALERIRNKLGSLRKLDAKCKVSGATSHRYRLGPPLAEPDLKWFERQLRITIPSEYRVFLAEIGHGGAGPYYGLFTQVPEIPRISALSGLCWLSWADPASKPNVKSRCF